MDNNYICRYVYSAMSIILKRLIPFLFLLILNFASYGQKNELGVGLGVMNYKGELAPSFNFAFSRPAGILFYRRNFSPVVAMRVGLTLGSLYAADSYYNNPVAKMRKAYFKGFLTEASCMLEYNFFNYIVSYRERKNVSKFTPYLTGGIALYNAQTTSNQKGLTSSYTKIAIPFGIGTKYMINDQWNLGFEFIARKLFTDRLDGISDLTINKKLLGDTVDNDMYYYLGVNLSYTFYKVHCPR